VNCKEKENKQEAGRTYQRLKGGMVNGGDEGEGI
jgi:hypothetical protein